jgi:hypothetical protein
VPQFASAVTGVAATLQTEITSGSTSPFLSQKIPPFPLTDPNLSTQIAALLNGSAPGATVTFGQQALNELSGLVTFWKLAPLQTSSN